MRTASVVARRLSCGLVPMLFLATHAFDGRSALGGSRLSPDDRVTVGRELFQREWVALDPRTHGGDGLGPLYNERSCLACHNQAGPGGGGALEKNVEIVTPIVTARPGFLPPSAALLAKEVEAAAGIRTASSVVLHKFATDPRFEVWRAKVPGARGENFSMRLSSRNTPALFGAGLIDRIPDAEIEEHEAIEAPGFPEIHGRVGRVPGGAIGRFGWKAQTASLRDFVRTACSVELGLEVPGHHQTPNPTAVDEGVPALDLNDDECDALTAYVASLPKPGRRAPLNDVQHASAESGEALFRAIGCAACHVPSLGDVEGLYSDLLLHDMGETMSDQATYYGTPVSPGDQGASAPTLADRRAAGGRVVVVRTASRLEWRTPPLWGVRDSAPYLHDGRARTLAEAIALHDGEAKLTAQRYARLSRTEKTQLGAFLLSLSAPSAGRTGGTHAASAPKREPRPKAAFILE